MASHLQHHIGSVVDIWPREEPRHKRNQKTKGFVVVMSFKNCQHVHMVRGPDGRNLNLHNVIFIDGGSMVWFEDPATFCVSHVFPIGQEPKNWDGKVRRYQGTWEPA